MNIYQYLNIPEPVFIAIALIAVALLFSPYLGGTKLGPIDLPAIPEGKLRITKILSPLIFFLVFGGFYPFLQNKLSAVTGRWVVVSTIDSSSLDDYIGTTHRFEFTLEIVKSEKGDLLRAIGEKRSYGSKNLIGAEKSLIEFVAPLSGGYLEADYFEKAASRTSTGRFAFRFAPDFRSFDGSFYSTAAETRGQLRGYRLPGKS